MDSIHGEPLAVNGRKEKVLGMLKSVAIIMTCSLAMIVNILNTTTVLIALPVIGHELDMLPQRLQWVLLTYVLGPACLLVICCRLADLYGRKLVFLAGSAWLFAFSIACGFARNELTLEILRGLQGAGAAATVPTTLGILSNSFPFSAGRLRWIAFTIFTAGVPLGVAVGTCIGAFLTELTKQTWRSNFFLTTALTGFYSLMGLLVIDKDEPSMEKDKRVDWLGAALMLIGFLLTLFALCDGELAPNRWTTPYIIAFLIVGCAFVALFLLWEWYLERVQDNPSALYSKWTPPPLMKLSIWTRENGRFSAIMMITFFTWGTLLGWNLWSALYYQNYLRLKPVSTMLRFIPSFITSFILNIIISLTINRISVVWFLGIGTFVTGCASLFFAVIIPSAPYWAFGFPGAICVVFGAEFILSSGALYVAKIVKEDEQSLADGLFQTMTQVGTAIGAFVTTAVFNHTLANDSGKLGVILHADDRNAPESALLKAFQATQWASFCFCMVATILVLIFFRSVGVVGGAPEPGLDDGKFTSRSSLTVGQSEDLEKKADLSSVSSRS